MKKTFCILILFIATINGFTQSIVIPYDGTTSQATTIDFKSDYGKSDSFGIPVELKWNSTENSLTMTFKNCSNSNEYYMYLFKEQYSIEKVKNKYDAIWVSKKVKKKGNKSVKPSCSSLDDDYFFFISKEKSITINSNKLNGEFFVYIAIEEQHPFKRNRKHKIIDLSKATVNISVAKDPCSGVDNSITKIESTIKNIENRKNKITKGKENIPITINNLNTYNNYKKDSIKLKTTISEEYNSYKEDSTTYKDCNKLKDKLTEFKSIITKYNEEVDLYNKKINEITYVAQPSCRCNQNSVFKENLHSMYMCIAIMKNNTSPTNKDKAEREMKKLIDSVTCTGKCLDCKKTCMDENIEFKNYVNDYEKHKTK